jgi:hypothetical protein
MTMTVTLFMTLTVNLIMILTMSVPPDHVHDHLIIP